MERWRFIPGWEGYYQASDLGRVRSVDRVVRHSSGSLMVRKGVILRSYMAGGRFMVRLCKDGVKRRAAIHQLVATTWIGPYPNGREVCHGPSGRTDHSADNLSYDTHRQNSLDRRRDGTHCGKAVRRSDGAEFINVSVAAEETGCSRPPISKVCNGHQDSACGYGWEFINN